jgi:hypothetical protein
VSYSIPFRSQNLIKNQIRNLQKKISNPGTKKNSISPGGVKMSSTINSKFTISNRQEKALIPAQRSLGNIMQSHTPSHKIKIRASAADAVIQIQSVKPQNVLIKLQQPPQINDVNPIVAISQHSSQSVLV